MKTNLKENNGITLIALIITIIVLLILAVVTISAVNEGGIFAHANNAATKYNAAATEENVKIAELISNVPGTEPDGGWKYNSSTGKYEKGENSYALGVELTYADLENLGLEVGTKTYKGKWEVIGTTSSNHLKLVSTQNVTTARLGPMDPVAIANSEKNMNMTGQFIHI